jgi:hypothetical protein
MALPSPDWSLRSGNRYGWLSELGDTFADEMDENREEQEQLEVAEAYAGLLGDLGGDFQDDSFELEQDGGSGGFLSSLLQREQDDFAAPEKPAPWSPAGGSRAAAGTQDAYLDPWQDHDQADDLDGYLAATRAAESGGNRFAKNPRSSAAGPFQFIDSTWNAIADRDPSDGITRDGRFDDEQNRAAMEIFTRENANALMGAGIRPTHGNLYAAHFLGPGGATEVLSQPDGTPLSALVGQDVLQANPFLAGMSVGDFRQWTEQKVGGGGGNPPTSQQGGVQMAGGGMPSRETVLRLGRTKEGRALLNDLIGRRFEQQDRDSFETYTDGEGNLWQRNSKTGEQSLVREAPNRYKTFEQDGVTYQEDAFGKREVLREPDPSDVPAELRQYEYYAAQERAAGREPLPYGEWDIRAKRALGGATPEQTAANTVTQASQMEATIDRAIEQVESAWDPGVDSWMPAAVGDVVGTTATGNLGKAMRSIGASGAIDLDNTLSTIKANLAFDALAEMRRTSPTGGALGSVTQMELQLLQDAEQSVATSGSDEALIANLKRLKQMYSDVIHRGLNPDGTPRIPTAPGAPGEFGDVPQSFLAIGGTPEEWEMLTSAERAAFD